MDLNPVQDRVHDLGCLLDLFVVLGLARLADGLGYEVLSLLELLHLEVDHRNENQTLCLVLKVKILFEDVSCHYQILKGINESLHFVRLEEELDSNQSAPSLRHHELESRELLLRLDERLEDGIVATEQLLVDILLLDQVESWVLLLVVEQLHLRTECRIGLLPSVLGLDLVFLIARHQVLILLYIYRLLLVIDRDAFEEVFSQLEGRRGLALVFEFVRLRLLRRNVVMLFVLLLEDQLVFLDVPQSLQQVGLRHTLSVERLHHYVLAFRQLLLHVVQALVVDLDAQ